MSRFDWPFRVVSDHSAVVILLFLVATLVVGAGVAQLQTGTEFQQYRGGSDAAQAMEAVDDRFAVSPPNSTTARIVVRDENAIDKETLVATLEYQRALRGNETVAATLADERPTVGLPNVLARAALERANATAGEPTIDRQIAALESLSPAQVERGVSLLLDRGGAAGAIDARIFVPTDYDPGSASTNATLLAISQRTDGPPLRGQADEPIVEAQQAMDALAEKHGLGSDVGVVGNGMITADQRGAQQESMSLLGPVALLFVLVTLALAYRDVVDVALGLGGILLVLVWTFGTLGWLGVPFSPVFVAVPVLLIGLSIDFAIHVFMRYREARAGATEGARPAMRTALTSVGVALLWVTVTTAIGFLSYLVSPIGPLRDIGVISATGIVSALLVFGVFVPAVAIELDQLLSWVGIDRDRRALGTDGSRLASVLSVGVRGAVRSPVAILLAVLLVSAGAAYGATQVSTSFEPQDFMPGESPDWMEQLPENVAPSDYETKANLAYVQEHFASQGAQGELYVTGDVTDPAVLERMQSATSAAGNYATVKTLANGEPAATSPLTVLKQVAARDPAVAERLRATDTDGDGVPDESIGGLYDAAFERAPDAAARVLDRSDGEYRAALVTVAVDEGASSQEIRADMQAVAAEIDGEGTSVVATGDAVVRANVQDELLRTTVESLIVTLALVTVLLVVAFRLNHGSWTLGLVTVAPVGLTVTWIVGSMTLLGLSLSVMTALVASLTIGIGVDYSIHLAERFVEERRAGKRASEALAATVTGTGAALFGSAVTTAGGFGVLALAVLPMLRQFGLVTALTVVYAFLAAVLVLPSLLVLWDRWLGLPTEELPADRTVGQPSVGDD